MSNPTEEGMEQKWTPRRGDKVEWVGKGLGTRKRRFGTVMRVLHQTCDVRVIGEGIMHPYTKWLRQYQESESSTPAASAPVESVKLPPLLKQLETEALMQVDKPWAEMTISPRRFLDALEELAALSAPQEGVSK